MQILPPIMLVEAEVKVLANGPFSMARYGPGIVW